MMILKYCLSLLTLISCLVISVRSARSQTYQPSARIPVSDGTMNTKVSGNGSNFTITGGLIKGQTLFQSFTDFSVPTNGQANFTNPVGNRDIITRVTGNSFSDINGLVNTNGANFFLINPNGVVFGTNARLNVGKTFVASTANSLDLVDAGGRTISFGTNSNGDAPLLSVAPNVLFDVARLNMGGGNGQVSNYGLLQTANLNQYIGLIGGNVSMNGGKIQVDADDGRVELGGLSAAGSVTLTKDVNNLRAQFPNDVARGDISLTNNATINVVNANGGDITITARNTEILGQSSLNSGIFPDFGGADSVAGDIKVSATGDILLADNSRIFNIVNAGGVGKGGRIELSAGKNFSATNGVGLATATLGQGDAGTLKITAAGNITFDGSNALSTIGVDTVGQGGAIEIAAGQNISFINGSGLSTSTLGRGDAGSLKIAAGENISFDGSLVSSNITQDAVGKGGGIDINAGKNLSVTNGAILSASTFGRGDAGRIQITAQENVSFDRGGALSVVDNSAIGKGGGIQITTGKNFYLANDAVLSASTFGQGDAGNIIINVAGDFSASDKGALFNSTSGRGDAGRIEITTGGNLSFMGDGGAFSSVLPEAIGKGSGIEITTGKNLSVANGAILSASTSGRGDAGSVKITARNNVAFDGGSVSSSVLPSAVGNGGGIEIVAEQISFTNSGGLTSSSLGQGEAGNIVLNANNIALNNGAIFSTSQSFPGGDIKLAVSDSLLLRNNSSIATDSFSTGRDGNGGNITISSPLIIALPGNNDITANAVRGDGGRVDITSQGLFGIKFRPISANSTSDITASSTFGQNGIVNISTPGTDPGRDSNELPNTTTDASNQISQVCSANNRENKLTVTGRGGLPPNANDPLTSDVVWQDARTTSSQPVASNVPNKPSQLPPPAVGMVFDGKGKVTLIAAGTQGQPTTGARAVCPDK